MSMLQPGQDPPLSPSVPVASGAVTMRAQVADAVVRYGSLAVLNGVSLNLHAGEIFGLLGPNGAGKTTLMKALCGRLALDAGTVRIDGANPLRSRLVRRRIGFVPQDIALYSYLTVRENLAVFARLAGANRRGIAATIARTLARTGLAAQANVRCRDLSGGYLRRVNICASILHEPSLLILDEPTVGIDVDAREAIHDLLNDLRDQGTAILLTTHDLEQAQTLCNRIGVLVDGRFAAEGRPQDLLRHAFGELMELTAVVGVISADRERALRSIGMLPAATPGNWMSLLAADEADLLVLTKCFADAGIAIKELRVRKPDLGTLYFATIHGKLSPSSFAAADPA